MMGLEMTTTRAKLGAAGAFELDWRQRADAPTAVDRAFACQLATSVWLRQLDDAAAGEVLSAYAMARCRGRYEQGFLRAALEDEYRLCRERLDLCS